MNLPIVLFLAFGVLFGLATYSNRHLFSEGSTRRGAGRGDPLDGRLAWVAGCALLWPFSDERFFAPWRPLPVAPIGRAFLSSWGLHVALWEAVVFAPFFIYALWPGASRSVEE